MNDFLITFGTLWVLICVYAILVHHFRTSEPDVISPDEIPRWPDMEAAVQTCAKSASGTSHPRAPRGTSRLRLQRCAKRSSGDVRSSRR